MLVKPKYWVLLLLILLGSIPPSNAASTTVDPKVLHIINRLSFGPRPGDVQRVESIGVERYIQEQLSPESIPEPENLTSQLKQLDTLQLNPVELLEHGITNPPGQKPTQLERKAANQWAKQVLDQAVQARLLKATSSQQQLQEVMVDFWYNHFNVDAAKGRDRLWVGAYEQQAIRPYALGRFRDLLGATARHPAMQFYLDNFQNRADTRPDAQGNIRGLNENYARELMELHTLGVDGGYTQQDVIALARILSGWGFSRPSQQTDNPFGFYFNPKRHDFSDKVFLGHTIKSGGEAQGEEALDILARSPATARHISYQIAQYFVSDVPPTALVNNLTQRYLATDGNIRELLNTLFHSREFWDAKNFNAKFKTPYQFAISAVRATGVEVQNTKPISNLLQQLGMPLYGCQTPDGYKNTADVWLNPDAMNRRLSFASAIANGNLPLSTVPTNLQQWEKIGTEQRPLQKSPNITVDAWQLTNTLGNSLSMKTQKAIASSSPQIHSALILGSPEFMHR
ncbi:DUF1800 domain-containing protein [Nostoc sp. 'Peltigera membranacea cyanobiont' 232]|uniref:DUF1800 domain-containing protein n=1 Tax=Nostoc sp. 'Peltigera membranacea cyanobiont' 232 TaxID=2014531 RepID=UPI000B957E48|nr:DUF1800 domain-containing protein [Nostoc sp. 'Peltigera membranacea cyanobiont' 232]OYE02361.1 hypothetical protein CDG79_24460 [Nostoc sp. 'Peltigera membranacea cyanobiont' 232]